jgi:hypothetical protein
LSGPQSDVPFEETMCAPSKRRLARSRSMGLAIRSFMNSWWADERQVAGESGNESTILWRASCVCGDPYANPGIEEMRMGTSTTVL